MAPRTITTIINVHCTAIIISNSYAELKTYKIKSGIQQKKKESTKRARDREIERKRKKTCAISMHLCNEEHVCETYLNLVR